MEEETKLLCTGAYMYKEAKIQREETLTFSYKKKLKEKKGSLKLLFLLEMFIPMWFSLNWLCRILH